MYKLQRKIIQIRMESNRETGIGGTCVSREGQGGSYSSITFNWFNLEYVFIAAFDYKSVGSALDTHLAPTSTKNGIWFALFTNYDILNF